MWNITVIVSQVFLSVCVSYTGEPCKNGSVKCCSEDWLMWAKGTTYIWTPPGEYYWMIHAVWQCRLLLPLLYQLVIY